MDIISEKHSCCAVFVSYNPEKTFVDNINQLIDQVSEVLIIDNNSSRDSKLWFKELDKHPKIKIIYNESNLGIATALNQGVSYAIKSSYEWLVTFDQDTPISDGFIDSLFVCYDSVLSKQDVAIIAPMYIIDLPTNDHLVNTNCYRYVKSTLTSGSLMKISAVKNIGLFDEDLFIDWVDHEYCMKARAAKYTIVQSTHTFLTHAPGDLQQHILFNLRVHTSNHSTLRRYYMYRNRVICYKRYFVFDPAFIFYDFLVGLNELIKMIFFEEKKVSKTLMVLTGIKDGIFNKTGIYSK